MGESVFKGGKERKAICRRAAEDPGGGKGQTRRKRLDQDEDEEGHGRLF